MMKLKKYKYIILKNNNISDWIELNRIIIKDFFR